MIQRKDGGFETSEEVRKRLIAEQEKTQQTLTDDADTPKEVTCDSVDAKENLSASDKTPLEEQKSPIKYDCVDANNRYIYPLIPLPEPDSPIWHHAKYFMQPTKSCDKNKDNHPAPDNPTIDDS